MLSRLSIRTRITLGSLLVAAILLIAALLLVRFQVATILSTADSTLAQSDLESFEADITANPDETADDPGTGVLVYVRNPDGEVQVNTMPHDVVASVSRAAPADAEYAMTDDEGRTYVVVGRAVSTTSGTWALWSARSTSASQLALEGLDHVLWVSGVALLLGFGAASWILATAALRPVAAMRRRADELGDSSAETRLPVGPSHDELAELATTLNSFLGRVQASSAREKQMVSDAAHELRTPLAALKTQLELAHGDTGNADALARQLREAEVSVDRLASLASNLLELSRLESGETRPAAASASSLVDEFTGSVDRARTLSVGTTITVDFGVDVTDDGVEYGIEPQAFGRLADNLLTNSINALATSGAVSATLAQREGTLILTVADDGPGMPDGFLPIAFERFTRPDASRTTATGGSGLGLALVRALATDAGGTARAENLRPGLAVTVTLPKM
jgi:signal transduction histidine kinase